MMKHEHQWVPNIREKRDECDFVQCGAAKDWPVREPFRSGIYDAYPEDPSLVRDVDFYEELDYIKRLADTAGYALADEHEGNFREAVRRLKVHTDMLFNAYERM